MKQLQEIVAAFAALCAEGKPSALATVIAVEGSAYRRPGARMLIAEDGRTWAGISGGCLERDVARRGRGVIASGTPIVCRYDTTDDENLAGGVATGCRGAVDLFIEPLSPDAPGPLPILSRVLEERLPATMGTIVRAQAGAGMRVSLDADGAMVGNITDDALLAAVRHELLESAAGAPNRVVELCAGSRAEVFVERIDPPQSLVIFGGGPDVMPVVAIAKSLGWHMTVVGSRPATGLHERFAMADVVHVTSSDAPVEGVDLPREAAVVLMTHNFPRDIAILSSLPRGLRYLGILGPLSRTEGLLAALPAATGGLTPFAPIGLDLGAETPEEIALAIIAEIQAVRARAPGGSLRDKDGPIHSIHLARNLDARPPTSPSDEPAEGAWPR